MKDLGDRIATVRRSAGLFRLPGRGVIVASGQDRVRWLNGMVSNDIAILDPDGPHSGCQALLLSRKGRILADLHVLALADRLLLETEVDAVPGVIAHLDKYIIADDVSLSDESAGQGRLALEGPGAAGILGSLSGDELSLEADAWTGLSLAGRPVRVAAYSLVGDQGFQLFLDAGDVDVVAKALGEAVRAAGGLAETDEELREILRIEAGLPVLGKELDESVLPDEARLEGAVSTTKGCYTGQEVVARLRARERVNHLLVGLCFEGGVPEVGAELRLEESRVGEVTSVGSSPRFGGIGLGFVKSEHAGPGTSLRAGECVARVAALPFGEEAGGGLGREVGADRDRAAGRDAGGESGPS